MPKEEDFKVAVGPQTTVLTIPLGGPFLVIPLNNEDILKWASEIKRQKKSDLLVLPGRQA